MSNPIIYFKEYFKYIIVIISSISCLNSRMEGILMSKAFLKYQFLDSIYLVLPSFFTLLSVYPKINLLKCS